MMISAIVPVKKLDLSKKRLSTILSPRERRLLAVVMLEDVLRALKSSAIHQIVVISPDSTVHLIANKFGVICLSENRSGLNLAIEQAAKWCIQHQSDSALVLPADVPLVSPKDIARIIELGGQTASLVLSPSRNGGTNALFRRPVDLMEASFGPNSYKRHIKEALEKGIEPKVYRSQRVSTDIDSEEDLKRFLEIESHALSRRFLERIGLRKRLSAHAKLNSKTQCLRPSRAQDEKIRLDKQNCPGD
jgi:2-phospho-L-lactate guanylyltransferase